MVEQLTHPLTGAAMRFLGNPIKVDGSAVLPYPPALGAHTRSVLTEVCGYGDRQLAELQRAEVIPSP